MALKKYFKMADEFGLYIWEGYYKTRKEAEADFLSIYGCRPYSVTYTRYNEEITVINI